MIGTLSVVIATIFLSIVGIISIFFSIAVIVVVVAGFALLLIISIVILKGCLSAHGSTVQVYLVLWGCWVRVISCHNTVTYHSGVLAHLSFIVGFRQLFLELVKLSR